MPARREWTLDGHGGRLAVTTWEGGTAPTSVALLAHGYGEHAGRYPHVADALVAEGAAVYAVDHVGHGRSEGERVLLTDVDAVVDDLHQVERTARQEHPRLPVVLVGHSMGGLIAARYAQRFGDGLTALVLSGPLLGATQPVLSLLQLPVMPDDPLDIATLSRDPHVGEVYAADPLVWHGPFKRPTVEGLQRAMADVDAGPSLGGLPVLWVHGEDDSLVSLASARGTVEHLSGGRHLERHYPGARHEVFNETNADEVLADVTSFLAPHVAAAGR